MSGEVAMWRAVVVRAFEDATSIVTTSRGRRVNLAAMDKRARQKYWAERKRHIASCAKIRNEARHWLLRNNGDFCRVCEYALLEPAAVREAAQAISRNQWVRPHYMPKAGAESALSNTVERDDQADI